jgi:L-lactate dehydrogenase complex protein LldG
VNAREDILSAIRARRLRDAPRPQPYRIAPPSHGLVAHFEERAKAAAAQVRVLAGTDEIRAAIADVLRSRNLPAMLHVPPDPRFGQLPWQDAPGLSLLRDPPGAEDTAISLAQFAIAETGTLVYPASPERPPSWHFRPGLEIAVLAGDSIRRTLEDMLQEMKTQGPLPSTVNLVTGPSRTGDIEQTLELGAHGPRELVILIVPNLPPSP